MSDETSEKPRVGLYLQVSTAEQTHEPQRQELLEYCDRYGSTAPGPGRTGVVEFVDQISGTKFTRVGLDSMMRTVRTRELDVVLCVKLDRLGRSLSHLAQMIGELDKHGVALICSSQGIDTRADNPAGRLQMHVLMAVAEFERSLIRERTKAGLVAARAPGIEAGAAAGEGERDRGGAPDAGTSAEGGVAGDIAGYAGEPGEGGGVGAGGC